MSNKQDEINFARVADAIEYITRNYREQPSLFDVAEEVNVSIHHFQRLFTEWAGVSPKKFLQYISVNHAKKILRDGTFRYGAFARTFYPYRRDDPGRI